MTPGLEVELTSGPNIATYPPGAAFGPRLLRNFEFVWLLEGDAEYSYTYAGSQTTVAAPQGTLLLCREGFLDSFLWDRKKRTRHGFFHFNVVQAGGSWPEISAWPLLRQCNERDIYAALTRHLLTWSEEGNVAQRNLLASALLSSFITGEAHLEEVAPIRAPDPVERAIAHMYQSLEEDATVALSLDALAKVACVTPEHLCRVFKVATGRTPLETVRLARLDRAAVLLARSNYSVSQVASLTGFVSPFHFSRSFKSAYGMSPRELQKAVARGEATPLPRLLSTHRGPNKD